MKVLIGFFLQLAAITATKMAGECNMAAFYIELGCTPDDKVNSTSTCPDSFTCPDLHPDPKMCYYRGKPFTDGSSLPQNQIINSPCSVSCRCRVSDSPRFDCAAVDCVEDLDYDLKQNCINIYELDSCCSTGRVCGKDEILKLKTCEHDGKTYKQGELIDPKDSGKVCVCSAKWTGSLEDVEVCRDTNCGLELHYQENLMDRCAPIFSKKARGCPIGFQCPSTKTKITRGINQRNLSSKCTFGNQTLSVGDEVSADEKCTTCSCEVPPYVTCTQKISCNST